MQDSPRISITRLVSPIRSTSCASGTVVSTRCGAGCTGAERLDDRGNDRLLLGLRVGDPHDEGLGAWLAKESVRDVYLTDDPADAALLLDKAITGCQNDDVAEIASLGRTLAAWRAEILAHHETGASNGPTEGLNLCVKKVKRCGHGFRTFEHYRLRVLLHAAGITCPRGHHHHTSEPALPAQMRRASKRAGQSGRPRQDSNLGTRFRKPMLSPLSYGG